MGWCVGVVANSSPVGGFLRNEELWSLDTKMDNGRPATGRMVIRGTMNACTDTSTSSTMTAVYLLSSTTLAYVPVFRNIF